MAPFDRFFSIAKSLKLSRDKKKESQPARRSPARFRPQLESLEELVLPALLDITGGSLLYTAGAGVDNALGVSEALGNYIFQDAGETIALSAGAVAAGWSLIDPHTATGPKNSATVDFQITLLGGSDALTIGAKVAATGKIDLQSGSGVSFASLSGSLATGAEVVVRADNGSVTQSNPGTVITAPKLTLVASAGIGSNVRVLETSVQNLNAKANGVKAPIYLSNAGPLDVDQIQVTGDAQVSAVGMTQTGPISAGGQAVLSAGGGNLNLGLASNAIAKASLQGSYVDFATGSVLEITALNASSDVSLSAPAGFSVSSDISAINRLSISDLNAASSFAGKVSANQLQILSGSVGGGLEIKGDATLPGGLTAQAGQYDLTFSGARNSIGALSLSQEGQLNLGHAKSDQTLFLGSAALSAAKLAVTIQGAVVSQGDLTLVNWKAGSATEPITLVSNNLYLFQGEADGGLNITAQDAVSVQGQVDAGATNIKAGTSLTFNGTYVATGNFIFQGGSIIQAANGLLRVTDHTALIASGDIFLNNGNFFTNEIQFEGKNVNLGANTTMLFKVWDQALPPTIRNAALGSLTLNVVFGDIIATTPVYSSGVATFLSGRDIDLGGFNELLGPVNFNGRNVSIGNINALTIAQSIATGSLSISTAINNADITQLGAIDAPSGPITLDAGTGRIVLDNPLNNFPSDSATTVTASQAKLADAGSIQLGAIQVSGTFQIESGADITESAAIKAGSTIVKALGSAALTNAANVIGPLALTAQNAAIVSAGAQVLAGVNVQGNFSLNAGGDITQTGPIINNGSSAKANLTSTSKILLSGKGNDLTSLVLSGSMADVSTSASMQVSDSKISGLTKLVAGGDLIGLSNSFGSDAIFKASGDLQFEGVRSTFGGTVDFEGTDVAFAAKGNFAILRGKARGTLELNSTGTISQVNSSDNFVEVQGASNLVAINDILLNTSPNQFAGVIALVGAQVSLGNRVGTILGTTIASGDLNVSSRGFGILQNSTITVGGKANFNAGGGDIELAGDNAISEVTLSGHAVALATAKALTVNALVANGDVGFSAPLGFTVMGDVSGINRLQIANMNANSYFKGTLSVNQFDVLSGKNSTLTFERDLSVAGSLNTGPDNYAVTLLGTNNQVGSANLANTGLVTFGIVPSSVTSFNSDFSRSQPINLIGEIRSVGDFEIGDYSLSADQGNLKIVARWVLTRDLLNAANSLEISAADSLSAGAIDAATLTVTSGGLLTQTKGWNVSGVTTISAGSVNLATGTANELSTISVETKSDFSLNNFFTDIIFTHMKADGNVQIDLNGTVAITDAVQGIPTIGGDLTVTTGGDILFAGILKGAAYLSGRNIEISNARGLTLGRVISERNLRISVTDTSPFPGLTEIEQIGAVQARFGGVYISNPFGSVVLDDPNNDLGTIGSVSIQAKDAVIRSRSTINIANAYIVGSLEINAAGSIRYQPDPDLPPGIAVRELLTLHAGQDIDLNPTNDHEFYKLLASANNIDLGTNTELNIAGIQAKGNVKITAGGPITQSGAFVANNRESITTLTSSTTITLENPANDFTNLILSGQTTSIYDTNSLVILNSNIFGNTTINSSSSTEIYDNQFMGQVFVTAGASIFGGGNFFGGYGSFDGTATVALDYSENTFKSSYYFNGSLVSVKALGDLVLNAGNASVSLSLAATGSITQDISQGYYFNVSGNTVLNAGGNISFLAPQNVLVGNIEANGMDIAIVNNGPLVISKIDATGDLILKGAGISQSGPITTIASATFDAGAGDILLGLDNQLGPVTLIGNNITVHSNELALNGVAASGEVSFKSADKISQNSSGKFSADGFAEFIAEGFISLQSENNQFKGPVSVASATGTVTIRSISDLTIDSISARQAVDLDSEQNIEVMGAIVCPVVGLGASGTNSVIFGTIHATQLLWSTFTGELSVFGPLEISSEFYILNGGDVKIMGDDLITGKPSTFITLGSMLDLNGHPQALGGLNGEGSIKLGSFYSHGSLVTGNGYDALFSGEITGYGTIYKSGSGRQTLDGVNSFIGDTQILQGTLQLGSATANGSVLGPILVGEGNLMFRPVYDQLTSNPIRDLDPASPIRGEITMNSPERATLTLAGENAFTGKATIQAGRLNLTSNLADTIVNGDGAVLTGTGTIKGNLTAIQGSVSPGSFTGATPSGKLTVTGEAVLGAQSNLRIGIGSSTLYSVLSAGKTTLQGGSLTAPVDPAYTPPNLQTFTVLQASPSLTGKFAQVDFVFSDPYFFKTIYTPTSLILQKVPTGVLPGATPLVVAPASGSSQAVIYDASNQVRARIQPMGAGWLGGMRVAVGDVTGDGFADYIFAAGAGGGPRVVVIDAISLKQVSSFFAYGANFAGGVYVAAGDIDGNGIAEIVTGPGAGGGPNVRAFNYLGVNSGTNFMAYNSAFRGGVTVATGDLDGDKIAEIITGAASQGSAHVQAFHANGSSAGLSFFAYAASFMGGVRVAAGDLNGDGIDEIVTGPGFSGGPNLRVFSSSGTSLSSIFAFAQGFTGGLNVGVIDPTHSGKFRIVAAPGAFAANYPGARVNLYDFDAGSVVFVSTILAYSSPFNGGLWTS